MNEEIELRARNKLMIELTGFSFLILFESHLVPQISKSELGRKPNSSDWKIF